MNISDVKGIQKPHHELLVVGQAAAVFLFGFILICIDDLTQVAKIAHHRTNKFHSCHSIKTNSQSDIPGSILM